MLTHRATSFGILAALLALCHGIYCDATKGRIQVVILGYVVNINFFVVLTYFCFFSICFSISTRAISLDIDLIEGFCVSVRSELFNFF